MLIWRSTPAPTAPGAAGAGAGAGLPPAQPPAPFQRVFESTLHAASVNMLAWAPHECGCVLACASSDGALSVLEFADNAWEHVVLANAHALGANSVSWAPATRPGSLVRAGGGGKEGPARRFVSGGSDCLVKIWDWKCVPLLPYYHDWATRLRDACC